jgi:ABC-2 type transport system permease protein
LQRTDGVLKRVRATPVEPAVYLGGQLLSTVVTTVLIAGATIALGATVFGVAPQTERVPSLLITVVLGICCFAALGLAISSAIRSADAAGAITNGTYLPLAMVSGMFTSTLHLPPFLDTIVTLFPLKALADGLRATYDPATHHVPTTSAIVLLAWTLAGIALAHRYFRWEP